MALLVVFIATLFVLESLAVGIGIVVERHTTSNTGLITFIACYFAMIWLAWRFAVRVTEPKSRLRDVQDVSRGVPEHGKPSAVLLGAYMAADELCGQSALLAIVV